MAMSEDAKVIRKSLEPLIGMDGRRMRLEELLTALGENAVGEDMRARIHDLETERQICLALLMQYMRQPVLSELERAVLSLRYESGMTWSQIAEKLYFTRRYILKVWATAMERLACSDTGVTGTKKQ